MRSSETSTTLIENLAATMCEVARESVTLVKRSAPDHAIKITRSQEWAVYLELLKVMFNLADRLSGFYVPIQDQPDFMNNLEDAVANHVKTVLGPTLSSSGTDDMEIVVTIGNVVSESRQTYERYRFVVTDQSKERDVYFQYVGEQLAAKAGAAGNQQIVSSASLCASAVIPAMKALFEEFTQSAQPSPAQPEEALESQTSATPKTDVPSSQIIKLISMVSRVSGEEVETRWGIYPRFQKDLTPEEAKELSQLMNQVARILGERFAVVATSPHSTSREPAGHA